MSPDLIDRKFSDAGFFACEVEPARDTVLMSKVAALRFHVYCHEQGFLNACDYPDGLESDDYDANSFHFASSDSFGDLAGYVRLVLPDAIGTLPFQNHCLSLYPGVQLPAADKTAEVSRLMVQSAHRRQSDRSPEILCSLFKAMYQCSVQHGVRYWYAAMERSLVRVLQRMVSVDFKQIGPLSDYYGPVAPYLIDLHQLKERPVQPHVAMRTVLDIAQAAC